VRQVAVDCQFEHHGRDVHESIEKPVFRVIAPVALVQDVGPSRRLSDRIVNSRGSVQDERSCFLVPCHLIEIDVPRRHRHDFGDENRQEQREKDPPRRARSESWSSRLRRWRARGRMCTFNRISVVAVHFTASRFSVCPPARLQSLANVLAPIS
jgi:hypothetical protein